MEDKRFQPSDPDAAREPRYDRWGDPIPDDPSFEEMEETLREIERRRAQSEVVILLEMKPFRF